MEENEKHCPGRVFMLNHILGCTCEFLFSLPALLQHCSSLAAPSHCSIWKLIYRRNQIQMQCTLENVSSP